MSQNLSSYDQNPWKSVLLSTHHHVLEGFGDDERHAPVGEDADSAGNPPHFGGENLRHDQPRDWTPTKSKTWTQQQVLTSYGRWGTQRLIHMFLKITITSVVGYQITPKSSSVNLWRNI